MTNHKWWAKVAAGVALAATIAIAAPVNAASMPSAGDVSIETPHDGCIDLLWWLRR